jgi:hypothetical protein
VNLKQIFETLNNFKEKTYQQKHVNIQGHLEIINFEFQNQ